MTMTGRALTLALVVGVSCASASAAAGADNYVALGDSYASGQGTGTYTLSAPCKRSTTAYPSLVAQQRPNTALTFVACSGATTSMVMSTQITSVTASTNIVTISVGGNDLGFSDVMTRCVTSDCTAALASTRTALAATLAPRLDTVYTAIRTRAAVGARVVVLGYPRLFGSAGCLGATGISTAERAAANQVSNEMDRVIALRAAAAGVTYKSAIAAFSGHAVCDSASWINGVNLFNTGESFHPSRVGNSAGYLPLVRQVIG